MPRELVFPRLIVEFLSGFKSPRFDRISVNAQSLSKNLVQDIRQNSTCIVVVDFRRGIEPNFERDHDGFTIGAACREGGGLHWLKAAGNTRDVKGGIDEIFDFIVVRAISEVQGQDAHADEVRAVDALEGLGDDRFDSEEASAFCGPVA